MGEVWKNLYYNGVEYNTIEISNYGNVKNKKTKKIYSKFIENCKSPYLATTVCLPYTKMSLQISIPKAVYESFNKTILKRNTYIIKYKDGDYNNCDILNLDIRIKKNKYEYVNKIENDHVEVIMNTGDIILLDKDFFQDVFIFHNWNKVKDNKSYYRSTDSPERLLHSMVVEYYYNIEDYFHLCVDHHNGNELDNRKVNLVLCSHFVNGMNSKRGKKFYKRSNSLEVTFRYNNKKSVVKRFYYKDYNSLEEAEEAAINYYDNVVNPMKEQKFHEELNKEKEFEFIRGLKYLLNTSNIDEINKLINNYIGNDVTLVA